MIKRYIFKELDLKLLNLDKVLGEIRNKKFTGFLKIDYWDRSEILTFHEGNGLKLVKIFTDGKASLEEFKNFRIENSEGSSSLMEADIEDISSLHCFALNTSSLHCLSIFPYGTPFHDTVPVEFVNIKNELRLIREAGLYGYMAFFTPYELLGFIVLQNGEPVEIIKEKNIKSLLHIKDAYISIYSLEPELVQFLYSMKNAKLINEKFKDFKEVKEYVESEKMDAIVHTVAGNIHRYDFFFRGLKVSEIVRYSGILISEDEEREALSSKVENIPEKNIHLYSINIITDVKRVNVEELFTEKGEREISPENLNEIKIEFIKYLGPVGKILWDKILKEMGIDEGVLYESDIRRLVDRLEREIPEEDLKKEFKERVKEKLRMEGGKE